MTPTKAVEKPPESHYLTHFPKHLGCESCFKTKTQKKPHRRKGEDPKFMPLPKPMKFGDIITADHLSFGKRDRSQRGDRFAHGVLDRYSGWIDCFPAPTKDTESVKAAMQEFLRSDDKVENFWTDNAPELAQAARELNYRHHRPADNRPQSNGVAERAMRRILEGTRSTLHRSGMDHAYWHLAMRCFCANSNFTDPWGPTAYTPHELRFNKRKFKDKTIPYGAEVDYLPTSAAEVELQRKAGPRMLKGICVGYKLNPGGVWSGE